jgi:hypothetical protein
MGTSNLNPRMNTVWVEPEFLKLRARRTEVVWALQVLKSSKDAPLRDITGSWCPGLMQKWTRKMVEQ